MLVVTALTVNSCNGVGSSKNESDNELVAIDFSKFQIGASHFGPIQLGDKINSVNEYFKNFVTSKVSALDYGFGGEEENNSVLYRLNEKPQFVLIPYQSTDSIIAIVILNDQYKTETGIGVGSTVADILIKEPTALCSRNLMSDWDEIQDKSNSIDYIFNSNKEPLATYQPFDTSTTPTNLGAKVDWITIFKTEK